MKNQIRDNSDYSNLFSGFKSYHHLIRFIIATIIVWSVILVSSFLFLKHYRDVGLEATFNEKGIPLISINNSPIISSVSVPANQLWIDTGLEFKPGQKAILRSTGSVCLAIHHLIDAANEDFKPNFPWVGPDGSTVTGEEIYGTFGIYKKRSVAKLDTSAEYGYLLAYIGKTTPGLTNPRPEGIQKVGKLKTIEYSEQNIGTGILYLVVNDDVLSPKDSTIYVSDTRTRKETYGSKAPTEKQMLERWSRIKKERYWNIWYDDNIGSFTVHVQYLTGRNK